MTALCRRNWRSFSVEPFLITTDLSIPGALDTRGLSLRRQANILRSGGAVRWSAVTDADVGLSPVREVDRTQARPDTGRPRPSRRPSETVYFSDVLMVENLALRLVPMLFTAAMI